MLSKLTSAVGFLFQLPFDAWLIWRWIPLRRAQSCGHRTAVHGLVRAHGSWTITHIRFSPPDYCHKCLADMAICCVHCNQPIFIGNMVALALVAGDIPDGARWHDKSVVLIRDVEHRKAVGCACCTDTIAECCGFWEPPGKVNVTGSLLGQAAASGQAVMSNDVEAGMRRLQDAG